MLYIVNKKIKMTLLCKKSIDIFLNYVYNQSYHEALDENMGYVLLTPRVVLISLKDVVLSAVIGSI